MTATFFPRVRPTAPPAPSKHNAWVNSGAGKFNAHKAVKTPVEIPVIPSALPILAVDCEARPVIPPIQHNEAAK